MPVTLRTGGVALALFLGLLVVLPLAGSARPHSLLALAGIFYKAGALVFGGGHVVLPLLRDALVPQGWLSDGTFLAGYGVAQAIPGPLFTFSAYLGAIVAPAGAALAWSVVALVFIFLPGLLIALAGLPVWLWLGHHPIARAALAGDQRSRRRGSRCRALQPDLAERGRRRPRCRDRLGRLFAARALAASRRSRS